MSNGYGDFIKSVTWNVGGPSSNASTPKAFYNAEIGTKSDSSVYVGLLNISDFAYATSGPTNGNRSTCLNANISTWTSSSVGCISNSAIVNDWLFTGNYEWTITSVSGRSYVYRMQNTGIPYSQSLNNSSTSSRTVVYLKENITFTSGNGSSDTNGPYHISLVNN